MSTVHDNGQSRKHRKPGQRDQSRHPTNEIDADDPADAVKGPPTNERLDTDKIQDSAGGTLVVPPPPAFRNETAVIVTAPPDGQTAHPKSAGDRQAGPAVGQPVDALKLWDTESSDGPDASLTTVRVDQNERHVIPFTTTMVRVNLHYVDFSALQGYVHCNNTGCLLCRVGRQRDLRDLLPVYDVVDRAVAVLPISPSLRPHALRPQLAPVLRRLASDHGPLLITLRKDGTAKFIVGIQNLPAGAADGAAVINAFRERFDAGQVDLASPFQRLANEDLATVDEIKDMMAVTGISL